MLSHKLLKRSSGFVAATTLVFGTSLVSALDDPFQQPPLELAASDFLPESVLSGEGYTVEKRVANDGVQNTYTVKSDYGVHTVTGTDELLARIQEIKATRALKKLEGSDEFKDAAKRSVTGLVEGGKALWDAPVETSKSAAKGVGRWLGSIGHSITSDDPHQDNAFETLVGYDVAKRGYAVAMGVDPYTDFEPFQERLGEVARAASAGALVTSMAIKVGTAGNLAGTAATVTRLASMQNLLKDNPPGALAELNREKLLADYITTVETGDIVDISGTAWLVSRSGSLVGAFPIDYLAWTERVDESTGTVSGQMAGLGAKRKELLLKGQVSPQARAALESRGWKITENVRLASDCQAETCAR